MKKKYTYLILTMLLSFLSFQSFGNELKIIGDPEPVDVSFLQFNIWQEGTQVTNGMTYIRDVILEVDPDIVNFVEVRNYNGEDWTTKIVNLLKAEGKTYYRGYVNGADVSIISKYPIVSSGPLLKDQISMFEINANGVHFKVASAHLDYTHYACYLPRGYNCGGDSPYGGWSQIGGDTPTLHPVTDVSVINSQNLGSTRDEAIGDFIQEVSDEKLPIVLLGDFNEPSWQDWTANQANMFDHNGVIYEWTSTKSLSDNGFVDSFRKYYPNEVDNPGFTWPAVATGHGTTSWAPRADERDRIDFIFYKGDNMDVLDAAIVGPKKAYVRNQQSDENTDNEKFMADQLSWPSDHKAVFSKIKIPYVENAVGSNDHMELNSDKIQKGTSLFVNYKVESREVGDKIVVLNNGDDAGSATPVSSVTMVKDSATVKFDDINNIGDYQVYMLKSDNTVMQGPVAFSVVDNTNSTINTTKYVFNLGSAYSVIYNSVGGSTKDWIGIYKADVDISSHPRSADWAYIPNASGTFDMLNENYTIATAGKYKAYLFDNDGYDVLAGPVYFYILEEEEDISDINPSDWPDMTGYWKFNDSNLKKAELGNDLELTGTDEQVDGATENDHATRIGIGSYYKCLHGVSANGGTNNSKVNEYSFLIDFKVSDWASVYHTFFQTNLNNNDDGELFINNHNGMIGGSYLIPYSGRPGIKDDTWYRMVVTVDLDNFFKVYLNGKLYFTATKSFDLDNARTSLSEDGILFFADESGEDGSIDVTNLAFFSKPLSEQEVAKLGGYDDSSSAGDDDMLPYLQVVTDNSVYISWHSDDVSSTTVKYGTDSNALNSTAQGNYETIGGTNKWHTVKLTGLQPNTKYYYQCISGTNTSDISSFVTQKDDLSGHVRFVLVGDSRTDVPEITKVSKGIENKLIDIYGDNWNESVDLLLQVGDIVENGTYIAEYKQQFFTPYSNLTGKIPFYVTIGNHERESQFYYQYMKYEDLGNEKYYSYTLGRIRFIALNSNSDFHNQTQLDWLKGELDAAKADDNIKFVFTYFHHPGHTEIWPDGNTAYVQNEVLPLLSKYPKASLIMYGHTHDYEHGILKSDETVSGNIQDAHMILSGGGGGPLDRWGMYANATNYPEIYKSIDHYNFSIIDVDLDAGSFTGKTYSLGHKDKRLDNELIDEWSYKIGQQKPDKPVADDAVIEGDYVTFKGSSFSGVDELFSSQIQITSTPGDYSSPVVDKKRDIIDEYGDTGSPDYSPVNLNKDVDITSLKMLQSEVGGGQLAWRIRYRDKNLKWSDWSDEKTFTLDQPDQATPPSVEGNTGYWIFEDASNLGKAEVGNDLELTGSDEQVAGMSDKDHATHIGVGSYYKCLHGVPANGGGSWVNEYSFLIDFKVPSIGQYYTLFQTAVNNGNDGDLFINKSGIIGGGHLIAYDNGRPAIEANKWYRLVVSVDLGNYIKVYLNGKLYFEATSGYDLDGRMALYVDEGVLFFADNDGEDNVIDVTNMAFYSRPVTAAEALALGDPKPSDEETAGVDEIDNPLKLGVAPNPVEDNTRIYFTLGKMAAVTAKVYDMLGKEVEVIMKDKPFMPGTNSFIWIPKTKLHQGVYFIKLNTQESEQTLKVLISR